MFKPEMKWLIFVFVLAVLRLAFAQTATEVVLHSFIYAPNGAQPCAGVMRDQAGNLYGTTEWGGASNAGVVYRLDTTGHHRLLYSFKGGSDGANPCAGVTMDAAGNLYGTTATGGTANAGVVYKVDPKGHETVLHSFTGKADGRTPSSGVVLDQTGNVYGTTLEGGGKHRGVLYKLDQAGHEKVLYTFQGGADGGRPSGVILDSLGNLYGATGTGGVGRAGTIYMLDTKGNKMVLYNFAGGTDGCHPNSMVSRDSAGNLYGTTDHCGAYNLGVVYKLDTAGRETAIHSFNDKHGHPVGGISLDSAGNIYGSTGRGGKTPDGVVYKLDASANFTVLHVFSGSDGSFPNTGLILDSSGNLYGTTQNGGAAAGGVVFQLSAAGQHTTLYSFPGALDGTIPDAGLTRDSKGNLYGTTYNGGTANLGLVYKLDLRGHITVLHNFTGGSDGADPYAGVTLDAAGNLYGTTLFGGPANSGVVYKVDSAGIETVLHTFTGGQGNYTDGYWPYAGVTIDSSGNLYGATSLGGSTGQGMVYKLDPTGQETILHSFNCYPDGCDPYAAPTLDAAGNLYGTSSTGGLQNGNNGGTIYKINASGQFSVLYSFTGLTDGGASYAGLTVDSADNLYGTTSQGGSGGRGVVFRVDPAGNEKVLYNFTGLNDGGNPQSGVIFDSAGNLYGTTNLGGSANAGVVYELNPAGQQTVLYTFTCGTDGCTPNAGLVLDAAGNLYGTTEFGGKYGAGPNGSGVIFKIEP